MRTETLQEYLARGGKIYRRPRGVAEMVPIYKKDESENIYLDFVNPFGTYFEVYKPAKFDKKLPIWKQYNKDVRCSTLSMGYHENTRSLISRGQKFISTSTNTTGNTTDIASKAIRQMLVDVASDWLYEDSNENQRYKFIGDMILNKYSSKRIKTAYLEKYETPLNPQTMNRFYQLVLNAYSKVNKEAL